MRSLAYSSARGQHALGTSIVIFFFWLWKKKKSFFFHLSLFVFLLFPFFFSKGHLLRHPVKCLLNCWATVAIDGRLWACWSNRCVADFLRKIEKRKKKGGDKRWRNAVCLFFFVFFGDWALSGDHFSSLYEAIAKTSGSEKQPHA